MLRQQAFNLGRSMPDAFVEVIDDDADDDPVILAGARVELCPDDVFWFQAGQQAGDDPANDAGATVYCSEDDYEAVCFTQMGTPLCQDCREMYEAGQNGDLDWTDGDKEEDDWLEEDDYDSGRHSPVYKMGDASPDGAIYDLDDVRFTRKAWKYTIVAVRDDDTGEWRTP